MIILEMLNILRMHGLSPNQKQLLHKNNNQIKKEIEIMRARLDPSSLDKAKLLYKKVIKTLNIRFIRILFSYQYNNIYNNSFNNDINLAFNFMFGQYENSNMDNTKLIMLLKRHKEQCNIIKHIILTDFSNRTSQNLDDNNYKELIKLLNDKLVTETDETKQKEICNALELLYKAFSSDIYRKGLGLLGGASSDDILARNALLFCSLTLINDLKIVELCQKILVKVYKDKTSELQQINNNLNKIKTDHTITDQQKSFYITAVISSESDFSKEKTEIDKVKIYLNNNMIFNKVSSSPNSKTSDLLLQVAAEPTTTKDTFSISLPSVPTNPLQFILIYKEKLSLLTDKGGIEALLKDIESLLLKDSTLDVEDVIFFVKNIKKIVSLLTDFDLKTDLNEKMEILEKLQISNTPAGIISDLQSILQGLIQSEIDTIEGPINNQFEAIKDSIIPILTYFKEHLKAGSGTGDRIKGNKNKEIEDIGRVLTSIGDPTFTKIPDRYSKKRIENFIHAKDLIKKIILKLKDLDNADDIDFSLIEGIVLTLTDLFSSMIISEPYNKPIKNIIDGFSLINLAVYSSTGFSYNFEDELTKIKTLDDLLNLKLPSLVNLKIDKKSIDITAVKGAPIVNFFQKVHSSINCERSKKDCKYPEIAKNTQLYCGFFLKADNKLVVLRDVIVTDSGSGKLTVNYINPNEEVIKLPEELGAPILAFLETPYFKNMVVKQFTYTDDTKKPSCGFYYNIRDDFRPFFIQGDVKGYGLMNDSYTILEGQSLDKDYRRATSGIGFFGSSASSDDAKLKNKAHYKFQTGGSNPFYKKYLKYKSKYLQIK
jgi:hypothetical protein